MLEIFLQPIKDRTFNCKYTYRTRDADKRGYRETSKKLEYRGEDIYFSLGVGNSCDENNKPVNGHLVFDCAFIHNNENFSKESYEKINLKEYVIDFNISLFKHNTIFLTLEDFVIAITKNNIDYFDGFDGEYIWGYSFKSDEQGNLYVEVSQNDKEVGTIDYNEFIESLKNKQYEKLATCTFTTFQPNNKKGKY